MKSIYFFIGTFLCILPFSVQGQSLVDASCVKGEGYAVKGKAPKYGTDHKTAAADLLKEVDKIARDRAKHKVVCSCPADYAPVGDITFNSKILSSDSKSGDIILPDPYLDLGAFQACVAWLMEGGKSEKEAKENCVNKSSGDYKRFFNYHARIWAWAEAKAEANGTQKCKKSDTPDAMSEEPTDDRSDASFVE